MAYMNILKFHSVQLPPMNCKITLVPPEKSSSYSAGDYISGTLEISLAKELYCLGIRVALEGTAVVKFKDQGFQSKTSSLVENIVFVHGKGEQRTRLPPGEHEFQFCLQLPKESASGLPGSFRSPFGLVLYQVVAYVQLEWKFVRKAEKTFNVASYYNLALQDASLFNPVTMGKAEKSLLPSFGRATNKLRFTFKMPQSGYLCGEMISFEWEWDNPAGYELLTMQISLIQKIIYNAGNTSKAKSKAINRIQNTNFDEKCWKDWIQVPHSALPTQKGLIEIQYHLKLEVKTSSQGSLRGDLPVVIGSTKELPSLLEVMPSETPTARDPSPARMSKPPKPSRPATAVAAPSQGSRSFKGLQRADSACPSPGLRPPRYSLLSLRSRSSSSDEPLPPEYDDALKAPKSPDAESMEIREFSERIDEEELVEEEEEEDVDETEEEEPLDLLEAEPEDVGEEFETMNLSKSA